MRSQIKSMATLAVGISLFGATGYFLYLLFKKDTDDDYSETIPITVLQTKLEVKIPKEFVRNVIGRNGSHVREIERKSQTKICFKEQQPDEKFRICVIRGASKNCGLAESLIHELISYQPVIETKELWVPCVAIGRIIGKCGERISYITQLSGAKIHVSDSESLDATEKRILMKGTSEQIELAKSYIVDIVREDAEIRKKVETRLAQREPRGKPKTDNKSKDVLKQSSEKLSSNGGGDGQIEVYVSAVVDPSQFHLQIVGPKANELDQLVEEMTEYYNTQENKDLHIIPKPQIGEIVAGLFQHDNKWYRAEISNLKPEAEPPTAELFFLDYGDSEEVPIDQILELRTDFLRLRFQAIECFLAKVRPNDGFWTEEATDRFCEMTQVAQWKKLRAKISGYRDRSIQENLTEPSCARRSRREGSPIPGVDLYDISLQEDLDIGQELVRQGFANVEESRKQMSSSTTSIESKSSKTESEKDSHFVNGHCIICHGPYLSPDSRSSTCVSSSTCSTLL